MGRANPQANARYDPSSDYIADLRYIPLYAKTLVSEQLDIPVPSPIVKNFSIGILFWATIFTSIALFVINGDVSLAQFLHSIADIISPLKSLLQYTTQGINSYVDAVTGQPVN